MPIGGHKYDLGIYGGLRSCLLVVLAALPLALSACERHSGQQSQPASQAEAQSGTSLQDVPKPNIVIILIDALRADRLGAYGHAGGLTPTMDALAAKGVTFEYCVSAAPWTLPSVATLFTSYYPGVHKATSYRVVSQMERGKKAYQSVLSDQFDTLAEVLHANGYQTAGFCAAKFLRAEYGFSQGFEHYDTSFAENTVRGSVLNTALFKWLDESRDASKRLFLYLHYMDVHGPYDASPRFMDPLMERVEADPDKHLLAPKDLRRLNPYLNKPPAVTSDPQRFERLKGYREYWQARYEAGVAEMDMYLSQLISGLHERGLWDDTYVILLADHGEAFCEHGFWEHGYSLYQTDLHVPLVMRWPDVLPAGKRVSRLASLIDVMPTLLEQLGLPPGENLQGRSLTNHISDSLPDMPLLRFAEATKSGPSQCALLVERTKLMVTSVKPRPLPDGTVSKHAIEHRLFNLASDPGEEYDISEQNPEHVEQLDQLLRKIIRTNMTLKPGVVVTQVPVDTKTMRALESLGYVGGQEPNDLEPNESGEVNTPTIGGSTGQIEEAEKDDPENGSQP